MEIQVSKKHLDSGPSGPRNKFINHKNKPCDKCGIVDATVKERPYNCDSTLGFLCDDCLDNVEAQLMEIK
jgi:hypothetical protein